MCAGYVYVVGFGEAGAERDAAGEIFEVESCTLRGGVTSRVAWSDDGRVICAYQRC